MLANDAFHIAVLARRRHRPRGHGAGARGAAEGRGDDAGPEVPLHRGAGRRRPLPGDRQVDAGVHDQAVRGGRRHPARRLRAAARSAIPTTPRSCRRSSCASSSISMPACGRAGSSPACPSPIVGAAEHGIDLVVIRESTEGLFASMGKGVVTQDEGRETLVITRKTSERLFDFSFRSRSGARRAAEQGQAHLRRQGQRVQGLRVLPPDVRRVRREVSRTCRPTGSTSTPARPCWCAGRGTSTSW